VKSLKDLLYGVRIQSVQGSTERDIHAIAFDSRKIQSGDAFVAVKGTKLDGHDFIKATIKAGAVAIICEEIPNETQENITYIQVANATAALSVMASNYYGNPSKQLKLVGITGTNGKTTVSSLLYQLFINESHAVGLLSTIQIIINSETYKTSHTTPDALTINLYLRKMVDAGVEFCFMEVSSHGIEQNRTEGLEFAGVVFTNLSHDHLDYHKTFAAYRDTKKKLFDNMSAKAFALTNIDDKNGLVMVQNCPAKVNTYALKSYADFRGQILENQFSGQLLKIDANEVWTSLIGSFNAYNVLAIYATATLLGMEPIEVLKGISRLANVSGRFQYVVSENNIIAIVDYAHTPDALENVLNTIDEIRTKNEQLITVLGCGGDRDVQKRPLMGGIAAAKSNTAIFTNDNPRTEDPAQIIEMMESGVSAEHSRKVLAIENRKQAIKTACQMANPNDIILIAGKGHEDYQEIQGERVPFNDFEIVKEFLKPLKQN
jgi:UDP-N-acetylmuramoyl-L-alanyl-D-glutamate--2,6-diaminopimelate ligase